VAHSKRVLERASVKKLLPFEKANEGLAHTA
jgi:hypothetical protein